MNKKLLTTLLALPMLLCGSDGDAATDFGEYKVKITVTNAEKWKVKWICFEADGSTSTIDSDTYPASTGTTRSTNINSSKCSTGDWKVRFQIKAWGEWKDVKPGSNVCTSNSCGYTKNAGWTYKTYAEPKDFNGSNKLCLFASNFEFNKIYVSKTSC